MCARASSFSPDEINYPHAESNTKSNDIICMMYHGC